MCVCVCVCVCSCVRVYVGKSTIEYGTGTHTFSSIFCSVAMLFNWLVMQPKRNSPSCIMKHEIDVSQWTSRVYWSVVCRPESGLEFCGIRCPVVTRPQLQSGEPWDKMHSQVGNSGFNWPYNWVGINNYRGITFWNKNLLKIFLFILCNQQIYIVVS